MGISFGGFHCRMAGVNHGVVDRHTGIDELRNKRVARGVMNPEGSDFCLDPQSVPDLA